jgi:PAS domain S-box-containing protein
MADGVVIHDPNGMILYTNPAMAMMLGCSTDELVGKSIGAILGSSRGGGRKSRLGSSTFEAEVKLPDGSIRHLAVKSFGITSNPPCEVAIVRDITRRRRAQLELRESEQRFRAIVTSLPIPALICRADSGKIIYANPAASGFLQIPEESVDSRFLSEILPEPTTAQGLLRAVQRHNSLRGYECRIRSLDGRRSWASLSCESTTYGKVPAIVLSILDIDERRRMEEDLRQREERYRGAISQADAVAYELNVQTLEYAFMGERIEQMIGFKPQEMNGNVWQDHAIEIVMRGEAEGLSHAEAVEIYRSGQLSSWKADMKVRTRDGQIRWIADSSIAVRDDKGRVVSYLGILQDITDRKEQEAALWSQEERLRQAHKLEAVGRLAGGISHDFSNLLTGIISYTELAMADLGEDSSAREMLEGVLQTAERGGKLIRQILSFSRRQTDNPEPVNLNLMVTDMSRLLRRLIGEGTTISLALQEGIPDIYADISRLEQVLLNLAVNARDAMPNGGVLTISSRVVRFETPHPSATGELAPGLYIQLQVSDTGTGIPPSALPKIFEPFFTTKEGAKGTGLGLSTVYGIVKQSGGAIHVESTEGEGTTFSLYFPPADQHLDYRQGGMPPLSQLRTQPLDATPHDVVPTILVVEDDQMVRQSTSRILQLEGYRVIEAASIEEAVALAGKRPDPPDLLLTDIMLGDGTGLDLAARMIQQYPQLRVVFVTAHSAEFLQRLSPVEKRHEWPVLQKPFSMEDLANVVREAFEFPSA